MSIHQPLVSVVIPAYNQARYLPQSIDSVLAQSYPQIDVVVVDDGSTDETPSIVAGYGGQVRYIWQENRGLAGARNTGIASAHGKLICLLDADDQWLPDYLEKMTRLALTDKEVAIYFCCAQGIDEDGNELPQVFGCHPNQNDDLLEILLRANFMIPSTVMMNYTVIQPGEVFDEAFRRVQDRELWIRLLMQGHRFRGLPEVLVNYRIHGESLSIDATGGQRAVMALAVKHFGTDDGNPEQWDRNKRRAFGGVYRYHVLSSVQRQKNWQNAVSYLEKALQCDPTLATDVDLFYDLALGAQPAGYRDSGQFVSIRENATAISGLLRETFKDSNSAQRSVKSLVYGTAYYAVGLCAFNLQQYSLSWSYLLRAVVAAPRVEQKYTVLKLLVKSTVKGFLRLFALRKRG